MHAKYKQTSDIIVNNELIAYCRLIGGADVRQFFREGVEFEECFLSRVLEISISLAGEASGGFRFGGVVGDSRDAASPPEVEAAKAFGRENEVRARNRQLFSFVRVFGRVFPGFGFG